MKKVRLEKLGSDEKIATVIALPEEEMCDTIERLCKKAAGKGAWWKDNPDKGSGYGTLVKRSGSVVFEGFIREE